MKKFLLLILPLLLLTSCTESPVVNVDTFCQNVNEQFDTEIMRPDDILVINEDGHNVSYWIPDDYNISCAMYFDLKTGIIKKYAVTSEISDPKYEWFCKTFEKAIRKNNQNIIKSVFQANNLIITVYEDNRYLNNENLPTLKSEINEKNLTQPVAENTIKDKNLY